MKRRIIEILMACLMFFCITSNVKASPVLRQNVCVGIDAGHGGYDPGKISVNGDKEKDINLSISLKLKKLLEDAGYETVLTRNDDNSLDNKKTDDMKKRCDIINRKADIAVSIHANSFPKESAKGAQVFYYNTSESGRKMAECVQQSFIKNIDATNQREITANNNYYMLRNTKCPLVIVECGFLSNTVEAKLLCTSSYQEKIAYAIFLGIEEYINKESESQSGNNNSKDRLYEY